MRNNDSKGPIAQAVDDNGSGLLTGCGEFCRLGKGTGGRELNSGEGGTRNEFLGLNGIRNALVLDNSLDAAELKAEIGGFAAIEFREKEFKVCHGWKKRKELSK